MSTLHRVLSALLHRGWDTVGVEITSYSDMDYLDVRHQHLAATAAQVESWLAKNCIVVVELRYYEVTNYAPEYARLKLLGSDRREWKMDAPSAAGCGFALNAALAEIACDDIDWNKAPADATHCRPSDKRFFKAGPNAHARIWSVYNIKDAWVAATNVRNSQLGHLPFIPRPTTDITLTERNFEMSDEQAKALALETRPMKVVMCKFGDTDKEYAYWAPADAKQGDYGVVYANKNIIQSRDMPFAVVQITQGEVLDTSRATKALLGTFNEDFAKHVEARIQHMASVRTKLALKKKAFEEGAFYEMMAKSDPEAALLLEELKQFQM